MLEILVCPLCKGPLHFDKAEQRLCCAADRLGFPVRDGIPVMLEDEAVALTGSDEDTAAGTVSGGLS